MFRPEHTESPGLALQFKAKEMLPHVTVIVSTACTSESHHCVAVSMHSHKTETVLQPKPYCTQVCLQPCFRKRYHAHQQLFIPAQCHRLTP